ncbi:hypothetical protein D1BOALGB6SA_4532 [Olavius sp. associated proteobacterium Delta 1]|nr:hypothetical protein D1BOALGB6SA_4532 [Olavius sp. associated proteobacterium Delta 1]
MNLGHCNLFVICDLCFGILSDYFFKYKSSRQLKINLNR